RYADVIERALYNGVLAGLSLSGDRFFYANPLSFHPTSPVLHHVRSDAERQPWYGCACCPPNIARLLASLGSYVYGLADDTVAVHLYAASTLEFTIAGSNCRLTQKTVYPWEGEAEFTVGVPEPLNFTLALRIPAWADGWSIDGADVSAVEKGYAYITRRWKAGDRVRLSLPIAPRRTYAHPAVRQDAWKVAIEYGPIVYCIEGVDNGADLGRFALPADAELQSEFRAEFLGGCTVITGTGLRHDPEKAAGAGPSLYRPSAHRTPVPFTAVPYALWNNRGSSEMRVWLAEV
ncbi:MAG: glycoside hydrolase family 127 protein, partial [Spirochaetaceae bacterium]